MAELLDRWSGVLEGSWQALTLPPFLRGSAQPNVAGLAERWAAAPAIPAVRARAALHCIDRLAGAPRFKRHLTCLPLALLRLRYLRALGQPARLHLGLRRGSGGWSGHAWVTVHGKLYQEPTENLRGLRETASFPRPAMEPRSHVLPPARPDPLDPHAHGPL